jgi:catechol 2,3-dioxygenase-like lactoylglutathione lyase family enzyme
MTEAIQTAARPVLTAAEPQLFVQNIQTSCDFYTNKLGFAIAFVYGEPPFYGQVVRDSARLNLRQVHEPAFVAIFASVKVCLRPPSRWRAQAK